MLKTFIFDIDGTLIDSNDFHALAWEKAFTKLGKTVSAKQIRTHLGKGADQLLPVFLKEAELHPLGDQIASLRGEIFKRDYLAHLRPFPKVRELFRKIREADARIALASSSKPDEIEQFKIIAQIEDLVEKSTSADDAENSKPEPDIFQSALKKLGNPPSNTVLVVGDTPYDAMAAVRAKLRAIGVLCGGFSADALRSHGCRAIYEDPADLLANLDSILKSF